MAWPAVVAAIDDDDDDDDGELHDKEVELVAVNEVAFEIVIVVVEDDDDEDEGDVIVELVADVAAAAAAADEDWLAEFNKAVECRLKKSLHASHVNAP